MRLWVIIPAYDAADFLAGVVKRVLASADAISGGELVAVCIIDDGSTDATGAIATNLAASHPRVQVIRRKPNGGYGAAVQDGLGAAIAGGADTVACVHADGQYAPEELPRLLAALRDQRLDVLQGSRVAAGTALGGGMPVYKYVANRVLTILGNLVFGLGMSDYYSGYLVYGTRALAKIPFGRLSSGFEFDLEVIAAARARSLRVGEAPIPTHYGDEVSHLSPVRYGLAVLGVMWSFLRGSYDA